MMKFNKIFNIVYDTNTQEKLILIDEIYTTLNKKGFTNKWNLKRSLQSNQGGKILHFGHECATVTSLLKFLFNNTSSTYCQTLVKQIEDELVCESDKSSHSSTLNLYQLVTQCNLFQSYTLFEKFHINESHIPTLVTDYKTQFSDSEWRIICWFENHVSNTLNYSELSFEDILKQKYSIYQNISKLHECGKSWIQSSKKYLHNNSFRVKSSNELDVTLTAGQRHLATVVDSDIKTFLDIYCPESVENVITFDLTFSESKNVIWAAVVQNKSLETSFEDICLRIFYKIKKKHNVYLERILLVEYDSLKSHFSKDGVIQRFTLRDDLETGTFKTVLVDWKAYAYIADTCEISENDMLKKCNRCFPRNHEPLTVDTFDIVQEWYVQLPIETQILFEGFINIRGFKHSKTPAEFLTKKLQKLYNIYDTILNVFNKNYFGIFQISHTKTLLIEQNNRETEYNPGPESRFLSLEDVHTFEKKKRKRTLADTQHSTRNKNNN